MWSGGNAFSYAFNVSWGCLSVFFMAEIFVNGFAGRIQCRYLKNDNLDAPIAILAHPNPLAGGTMNNKLIYKIFYALHEIGFSVLRYNSRGVGKSFGSFDNGVGEVADISRLIDHMKKDTNPLFVLCVGYSFGGRVALELQLRRSDINLVVAIAPDFKNIDQSFSSPLKAMILQGDCDEVTTLEANNKVIEMINHKTNSDIELNVLPGFGHIFTEEQNDEIVELIKHRVLQDIAKKVPEKRRRRRRRRTRKSTDADL